MAGKKKEEGREYKGWGKGTGESTGHNGGRKPPEEPKRQRNFYVTEEEFNALKDYLWNVLRKGQRQTNRKHKTAEE